jgi:peptidoglycan/LPS O-acetylase OafA/YrhL
MDGRTLEYQPALDGVRALAVIVVLLFHAEVPGFSGGYLGVSVFFTLSGYLITRLLLAEEGNRVDLGRFYSRRLRRLMPASLACITGVVILSLVTDWFAGVTVLRAQVVGALLQVSNWVQLAGGGSYQELFDAAAGSVSPLEHYWSLAIEEQFYWLWPLVFVVMARRAPSPRSRLVVIGGLTLAAAIAAPVIAVVWGPDGAYWATPARAAEILMGALLAVLMHDGRLSAGRSAGVVGPVALGVLGVAVVTFPSVGGPAYDGALPLVAVVSASLIFGLQRSGVLRSMLSVRPLVAIGVVSYGVYLFHWPVFVVLDAQRTGLDGPSLVLLRFAVTGLIAVASYRLIERPVRSARSIPARTVVTSAVAATGALVVFAVVTIPPSDADYWATSADVVQAAAIDPVEGPVAPLVAATSSTNATAAPERVLTSAPTSVVAVPADPGVTTTSTPTSTTPVPIPELARPVRIVVAGDSTAEATGVGLVNWAYANPTLAQVELVTGRGCGFGRGGDRRVGEWQRVPQSCDDWLDEELPDAVERLQPDVVALMTTSWDVLDRRWPDGLEGAPTDAAVAERLELDLAAVTLRALESGAGSVAWIRQPIPDPEWLGFEMEQEQPARHQVLYDAMDALEGQFPDRVEVVDLPAFVEEIGWSTDQAARPDGVHWTSDASTVIAERFLGDRLVRAALER